MNKFLALCGWASSGKDTAADALELVGWDRRAFADPLRKLALECDPIIYFDLDDEDKWRYGLGEYVSYADLMDSEGYEAAKKSKDEFRSFLQRLGAGARLVFGDSFWIDQTTLNLTRNTVWTDCRYVNEAEAIRSLGGFVVRIERPGTGPANSFEEKSHGLIGFEVDAIIQNDGSKEDLHKEILKFISF